MYKFVFFLFISAIFVMPAAAQDRAGDPAPDNVPTSYVRSSEIQNIKKIIGDAISAASKIKASVTINLITVSSF